MKKTRFYTLFFLLLLPLNITTDSEYKESLEDYDGDGLPDAYELANDNDPYDRNDVTKDADGDGLTIQEEFIAMAPRIRIRTRILIRFLMPGKWRKVEIPFWRIIKSAPGLNHPVH